MFTRLAIILTEAGMDDLAHKVCVWDVHKIMNEAMSRNKYVKGLDEWYREWCEPYQPEEAEY
jgi:hypothetical protein